MDKPKISPKFRDKLRRLYEQEMESLRHRLEHDSTFRPVIYAARIGLELLQLDGHHTREICEKIGREYEVIIVPEIETEEDAILWILTAQLGRRNLSQNDASKIRAELYELLKKDDKSNLVPGAVHKTKNAKNRGNPSEAQNEPPKDTATIVGKKSGVSAATVKRDVAKKKALDAALLKLSVAARKGYDSGVLKGTDEQLIALSKMPDDKQNEIARSVRVEGKKLSDLLPKSRGSKPATNSQPTKPAKPKADPVAAAKSTARQYIERGMRAIDDYAALKKNKAAQTFCVDRCLEILNKLKEWK